MNKEEFLGEIQKRLAGLPQNDIDERVAFYREIIEDRMEEGMTEEDAVAGIGTVDEVVSQIMSEIPLTRLVRGRVKPKRTKKAWEIVLLVLGSPVWLPLVISAVVILLALYVVIWAVVISLYATDLSLAAGTLPALLGIGVYLKAANPMGALFSFGFCLVCAGLAILLFFGCVRLTKGIIRWTGRMLLGIKTSFVGKEA